MSKCCVRHMRSRGCGHRPVLRRLNSYLFLLYVVSLARVNGKDPEKKKWKKKKEKWKELHIFFVSSLLFPPPTGAHSKVRSVTLIDTGWCILLGHGAKAGALCRGQKKTKNEKTSEKERLGEILFPSNCSALSYWPCTSIRTQFRAYASSRFLLAFSYSPCFLRKWPPLRWQTMPG